MDQETQFQEQEMVEQDDEGLPALQAEALLANVLRLQEGLEGLRLLELGEDASALAAADLAVDAL